MSSGVWKYFVIDNANPNYAKCRLCNKLISRGGVSRSTTGLNKHLNSRHKSELNTKLEPPSQATSKTQDETLSVPSTSTFNPKPTSKFSSKLQLFAKPRPKSPAAATKIDDYGLGLGPTAEEMEVDSDLLEVLPPINEPLSVDVGQIDPGVGLFEEGSMVSPESASDTNISVSDTDLQSPLSCAIVTPDKSSVSPALYPRSIKLPVKKQRTLQEVYEKKNKFTSKDPRAVKIDTLIAEMICLDLQPISIVEDKGFLRLLNHFEPRYNVPSRKTFSERILIKMYQSVLTQVNLDLLQANHVAITTDMWTSVANCDYMAVTAHFYSEEKRAIVHKCLECIPFPEISHTGANIRNFLEKVFEQWNIQDKIVGIVRDNGPDITSALNSSTFTAYPCVAHTLQLVVKDGCVDHPKINNVVKKAKKLVGSFKKSAKNTKVLKSLQKQLNLPEHRLIQEEPTRWNTTFYMLKRLIEQKDALVLISGKPEVSLPVELTTDDFKTMKVAVEILEIFETATRQVSKESSTISEIIPLIHTIEHFLVNLDVSGTGLQGLKNDVLSSLRIRYASVEDNINLAVATLLDPRFKVTPFKQPNSLDRAKKRVLEEMESDVPASPTPEEVVSSEPSEKTHKSFWSHYAQAFAQVNPVRREPVSTCDSELKLYLNEQTLNPKEDMFAYWEKTNYSRLKKVATKYMCIPPATVFSERLFSTAGLICDKKRNRLDPERVKMLVFLHKNLQ